MILRPQVIPKIDKNRQNFGAGHKLLNALYPSAATVTSLILSGHFLTSVGVSDLSVLSNLEQIDLSNGVDLTTISSSAFLSNTNLISLYINNCQLTTPQASWVSAKMIDLNFSNNPWVCDCNAYQFEEVFTTAPASLQSQIVCASPSNLAGQTLYGLSETDLNCYGPCPEYCSCAPIFQGVSINCTAAGLTSFDQTKIPTNTVELILAQNSLTSLNVNGLSKLKYLDVSYNMLTSLPKSNLPDSKITYFDASYNQLQSCDIPCGGLEFIFLSHNQLTEVGDFYTCSDAFELDLDWNLLTSLPPLTNNSFVSFVTASSNQISEITLGMFSDAAYLTGLQFVNNSISDWPVGERVADLQSLNLALNQISTSSFEGLTDEFSGMSWIILSSNDFNQGMPTLNFPFTTVWVEDCNMTSMTQLQGSWVTTVSELKADANKFTSIDWDLTPSSLEIIDGAIEVLEIEIGSGETTNSPSTTVAPTPAGPFSKLSTLEMPLNLISTGISNLPPSIKVLNLSKNELTNISDLATACPNLQTAAFDNNAIASVSSFGASLQTLTLAHNSLSDIPASAFSNCNVLTSLDISFNQLTSPNSEWLYFFNSPSINQVNLNLSNNKWNCSATAYSFKQAYSQDIVASKLDLTSSDMHVVCSGTANTGFTGKYLDSITGAALGVDTSSFGTWCDANSVCKCSKQTFGVVCNQVSSLPTSFDPFTQTISIFLDSSVTDIGTSLSGLTDLSQMAINGGALTSLNAGFIANNYLLNKLVVNQISTLATAQDGFLKSRFNLKSLDLSQNGIAFFPSDTFNDSPLITDINFNGNQLTDSYFTLFTKLNYLSTLDMGNNNIPLFEVKSVPSLTQLKVSGSSVTNLTSTRNLFPLLTTFDFSNNMLSSLSQNSFSGMQNLASIDLANNNFTSLPSTIFQSGNTLISLTDLDLSFNQIDQVGNYKNINLPKLAYIGLQNNVINYIDSYNNVFTQMPSLGYLDLSHNALAYLPAKALNTVPALSTLLLDFNMQMTTLADYGTYFVNPTLKVLSFNNCSVIGIQENDVSSLTGLIQLKGASNGLFSVYKDAFPAKLTDIDISYNALTNVDPRWFAACTGLQNLEMQGNPFVCNCASELYYYASRKYTVLQDKLACSNFDGTLIDDLPPHDYCNQNFTIPTVPVPTNDCPTSCTCYNNNTQVQCVSKRLSEVPLLPINAVSVNLNNNEIKSIHAFDFSQLPNLQVLTMNQNLIQSISPKAFPAQLQNISLSTNNLGDVSGVVWPSQMGSLDLSRNQLSSFNLTTQDIALYSLTLDANDISTISGLEKTGIFKLSCVGCSLTSMPSPAIGGLQILNLQSNMLTGFDKGVVYSGLSQLLLASNQISDLSNFNLNFPNLALAYLPNNNLTETSLAGGPFFNMYKLTSLTLNNNFLTNIPTNAFEGLQSCLSKLNLQGNQIQAFPTEVASLSVLSSLNLDNNQIFSDLSTFTLPDSLAVLTMEYNAELNTIPGSGASINELDISHCGYTSVPDLTGYPNLTQLIMDSNTFVTTSSDGFTIHNSDFSAVPNLQTFTCGQCNISDIDPAVFNNLPNLKTVSFTANKLKIPRGAWFQNNTNIQTVGMTANPWNCDCHSISYKALIDETQAQAVSSYNPFARNVKCNTPDNLSGQYIDQVSYSQLDQTGTCPNIPSNFTTPSPSTGCPAGCYCASGNSYIDCTSAGYTSVPSKISSNVRILILDNNNISSISQSDFSNLKSLSQLSMKNNTLSTLPSPLWYGLANLNIIYLNNNQISSFSSACFPAGLNTIDFSNNMLTGLNNIQGFSGLKALQNVYVKNNRLTTVDTTTFGASPLLSVIDLTGNFLKSFPDFSGVAASLSSLRLTNNSLTTIAINAKPLTKLTTLYLDFNQIITVGSTFFANIPALANLVMNDNQLTTFAVGAFDNSTKLVELNVANNDLANLPGSLLQNCQRMKYLNAGGNQNIGNLNFLFALTTVQTVFLNNCGLTDLGSSAPGFGASLLTLHLEDNANLGTASSNSWMLGCQNLGYVYLGNTGISSVPTGLPASLYNLDISRNPSLNALEANSISLLTKLSTLTANNCSISSIDDKAFFYNTKLIEINLDWNQLTTPKPVWFINGQNLAIVIWSQNPWICDCHAVPFAAVLENSHKYHFRSVFTSTVVCSDKEENPFIEYFSVAELSQYGTDSLNGSFDKIFQIK